MPDTLGPFDIKQELARRLPSLSVQEINHLTEVFVDLAAGKYITGKRLTQSMRNAAIRTLFDGSNLRELARRFSLSTRQIRRLAEKQ